MMFAHLFQNRFIAFAIGLVLILVVGGARADPPARAARLAYTSGDVSFSPAGGSEWVQATLNRPLTTGDRLWADANALAELQMGGAAIRLSASTELVINNLDDKTAQLALSQGSLNVRVRQMARDQSFEVQTPNLVVALRQAGEYRIDVDPSSNVASVKVRLGRADVYADRASSTVEADQAYRFYGANLSGFEPISVASEDGLDRWSHERERRAASSDSARYVSYEVVGYEDLDAYGTWRTDPIYGNVWQPNQLQPGWTPYRNGHWTWIDPWGWNWVDDAPWGYAVSHYGRWARINGFWGWVPGPRQEQAVFAPALVVFVDGNGFQNSRSGGDGGSAVGWFPLGPHEVYRPAYEVSHAYFDRVNRSNAVIASTTLVNIYQNNVINTPRKVTPMPRVVYVNQGIAGAVVAAPKQAFTHSEPTPALAPQPVHSTERPARPIDDHPRRQPKLGAESEASRNLTVVPIVRSQVPPAAAPIPAVNVNITKAQALKPESPRPAAAKPDTHGNHAERAATSKGAEPAKAPNAHASEARAMHKHSSEAR
jgi:hypothetical protein